MTIAKCPRIDTPPVQPECGIYFMSIGDTTTFFHYCAPTLVTSQCTCRCPTLTLTYADDHCIQAKRKVNPREPLAGYDQDGVATSIGGSYGGIWQSCVGSKRTACVRWYRKAAARQLHDCLSPQPLA